MGYDPFDMRELDKRISELENYLTDATIAMTSMMAFLSGSNDPCFINGDRIEYNIKGMRTAINRLKQIRGLR